MIKNLKYQQGFTLIEVAVVFVILAALLAASIYPLTAQRESAHITQSKIQLAEIQEAIYGFAIAQGRIPCPAEPGNGGVAEPINTVTGCDSDHGFIPSATLGISGSVNCDGLLLDAWGQPYRYSVTGSDSTGSGNSDFTVSGEINSASLPTLNPNLKICRNLDVGCPASTGTNVITENAVAVIYSLGKPRSTSNAQEDENAGEATIASTCGLDTYDIANDNNFYAAERREIVEQEFDDILVWISPAILYAKLLQANRI